MTQSGNIHLLLSLAKEIFETKDFGVYENKGNWQHMSNEWKFMLKLNQIYTKDPYYKLHTLRQREYTWLNWNYAVLH